MNEGSVNIPAFPNNVTYEQSLTNSSNNESTLEFHGDSGTVHMVVTCLVFGVIILLTIIGNVFVIATILLERSLQKVSNYLIVSLAVADLLVGCLVMPLGVVYEINKGWFLGVELCDFWTSCDVLCCTASILNLVAIAVDRYWAVTNINYTQTRSKRLIFTMIAAAWCLSLIVALPPQFGWKDPDFQDRVEIGHVCIPSTDFGYQMFSYSTTIFIPLPLIIVLYWKIYQTARKSFRWRREQRSMVLRMRNKGNHSEISTEKGIFSNIKDKLMKRSSENYEALCVQAASQIPSEGPSTSSTIDVADDKDSVATKDDLTQKDNSFTTCKSSQRKHQTKDSPHNLVDCSSENENCDSHERSKPLLLKNQVATTSLALSTISKPITKCKNQDKEAKKERKTAKVLAIITGVFAFCWIPFFTLNFLMTRFNYSVDPMFVGMLGWLAYFNSTINPIIYTLFSPEFHLAFKRLLCRIGRNRSGGTPL